ncbi:GSCOCG00002481001-RA-CDS, partial [Cotesia congregata]
TRGLQDDLDEFMALIPKIKVMTIFLDYMKNDAEVQAAMAYIKSEDFHQLVRAIEKMDHVKALYKYLYDSGLDIYREVNGIHGLIGMGPFEPFKMMKSTRRTGGMAGLIADIMLVLPKEKFKALYYEKLETSEEFKKLIERLKAPEFQEGIDLIFTNEEIQFIFQKMIAAGVDVKAILSVLSTILGYEFPDVPSSPSVLRSIKEEKTLHDDLDDFMRLLPFQKMREVAMLYLEHDEEVKSVVEYVQSKEFVELVRVVEAIEDVIRFYDYLHESGLNVYDLVNKLHDFVGLPHLPKPSGSLKKVTTNGVAGLIAEIKALLPFEEIKAMYYHKLETSVHFKQLVERLQSPEFQAIIDTLLANQEFQAILAAAKKFGVDVKALADLLSTVFGLEFPSNIDLHQTRAKRSLRDDLDDFVRLLPLQEIEKVVVLYVEHDEEVKSVIEYVQSEEFVELVREVESIEDVIRFYDYLHESGLNVYDLINKLHDFVGLPHLPKPSGSLKKVTTNGVAGLIAEIKALLPFEEIKAMYYYKLETSVHFKQLVERLQSPKFQAIIDTLLMNQEFQEIITAAKKFGVDVRAVADLLSTMFGLEFPSSSKSLRRTITDHLNDFIVLLPLDKIAKITVDYILNDVEVIIAVEYLKSDEFKDLMVRVENDPEVVDFFEYLKGLGADFHDLVSTINDFLDIHPQSQQKISKLTSMYSGGGIQGMLNEIHKVIPYDEFKALYEHKIKTSEEFKFFHEQLKSPEFQARVDKLVVNPNLQELGAQAYMYGISINKITEFLSELIGLKFPEYPSLPASPSRRGFRNLNDDLNDFFALVSFEKIIFTVVDYVMHDDEVQKVAIYLRSEEFRVLDQALNQIPEYNDILKELSSIGFNVGKWINDIHSFLGIDYYQLGFKKNLLFVSKPGVAGLIEAIKALLPYENIKNLYHEKLETSEDFRFFVELIKSEKFQKLTDTLFANKEFQSLLHKAKSHGINLTVIADFFLRVFGITTPSDIIESM